MAKKPRRQVVSAPPGKHPAWRWPVAGLALLAVAGALWFVLANRPTVPPAGESDLAASASSPAHYVGSKQCAQCHAAQYQAWQGSHHDLAMRHASAETVLGNFDNARFRGDGMDVAFTQRDGKYVIRAPGPDGKPADFEVKYTFGATPLQQYLLELPGGRLQAFSVAWDSRPREKGGQRWFHLYPGQKIRHDDELHWSGQQQNWNFMCADCHSTNLRKNYDPSQQRFATTWSEINVGCEACHGPGSAHVAWAGNDTLSPSPFAGEGRGEGVTPKASPSPTRGEGVVDMGLTVALDERHGVAWNHDAASGNASRSRPRDSSRELEVCAQCHSLRAQVAEGYQPGRRLLDHYLPTLPSPPNYFADGQQHGEVYTWASFLQSRMHAKGVTCSDCHQPHSLKLRAQGNAVCAQCHTAEKYDSAQHHFHKLGGEGALCVSCHMPQRMYMVVDGRHDHSLRVPRPDITLKRGADKAPNACNNCHGDKDAKWAADAVVRWHGPNRRQEVTFGETLAFGKLDMEEVRALAALSDDNVAPAIIRATALQQLAALPVLPVMRAVVAHAGDSEALVRLAAAEAAPRLPPQQRAAAMLPLLHDENLAIRLVAVSGLLELPRDSLSQQQQTELDIAIAEYRKSQIYNADRAEAQANLGQLEMALGNVQAAIAAYERAIRLNPHFVPAYIGLGDVYARLGREQDAGLTLRQALRTEPENADAHHALGLSLARAKLMNQALIELRRAAELRPDNGRYVYVYAVALHETGDKKQAIKILQSAANKNPMDSDILDLLVRYLSESGDRAGVAAYAMRLQALRN